MLLEANFWHALMRDEWRLLLLLHEELFSAPALHFLLNHHYNENHPSRIDGTLSKIHTKSGNTWRTGGMCLSPTVRVVTIEGNIMCWIGPSCLMTHRAVLNIQLPLVWANAEPLDCFLLPCIYVYFILFRYIIFVRQPLTRCTTALYMPAPALQ